MISHRLPFSLISVDHKLYGSEINKSFPIALKAGSLSMHYENGALRYISSGKHELIRMIYSAVRDKEWLNVDSAISNEKLEINPVSFRIKYKCRYLNDEIDFMADFVIEGNPDNSLVFSFEGEALRTFSKNRAGFCILHPIEGCAGKPCKITHSDNTVEKSEFPVNISPHQLFTDIKSIHWKFEGLKCSLYFHGDIFETEDQRNWTDASYKTYCTPLAHPFPVTFNKGDRISQKIELKVTGDFNDEALKECLIRFTIDRTTKIPLPAIGIGRSTRPLPLTDNEIMILRKLKFDHYRVELYLFETGWKTKAEIAVGEAEMLNFPLELAIFFDDNALEQCVDLIAWLTATHTNITLIILYHITARSTPDIFTDSLSPLLRSAFPGVKIASGTNANFAQLNRDRPQSVKNDYICYSVHPQEHASDNATLVENLKAQEFTVDSARKFAKGKGICISPVNLQRRFNANIQNYEAPVSGNNCPPQVDPRIMSLFGACWTAGSMKYLFESGIKSVTFFETVGERGIMQGDFESRWPGEFPSVKEMIFPVFHVLRYILENKSYHIVKSISFSPLKVDLLVLSDGRLLKAIIVNFTTDKQEVKLDFCDDLLNISQLDAGSFTCAASNPEWQSEIITINSESRLQLKPFSVNFIEGKLREEFLKT